jgi:large subunit ribosomal protein L29
MKKANDFRDQTLDELDATYRDLRKTLFQLVNELRHEKKLEKPHLIRQTKKEIARLLTIVSEKQLTAQSLE